MKRRHLTAPQIRCHLLMQQTPGPKMGGRPIRLARKLQHSTHHRDRYSGRCRLAYERVKPFPGRFGSDR